VVAEAVSDVNCHRFTWQVRNPDHLDSEALSYSRLAVWNNNVYAEAGGGINLRGRSHVGLTTGTTGINTIGFTPLHFKIALGLEEVAPDSLLRNPLSGESSRIVESVLEMSNGITMKSRGPVKVHADAYNVNGNFTTVVSEPGKQIATTVPLIGRRLRQHMLHSP
jgi:hypothetical protein